jgi:tetratricopeptide (TPR) repeat protein
MGLFFNSQFFLSLADIDKGVLMYISRSCTLIFFIVLLFFTGCDRKESSLYHRYSGWIHSSKHEKLGPRIDEDIMAIQKKGKATPDALKDLLDLSRLGTEMMDADRAFEAGLRAQSMAEVLYGPKEEKTIRVYLQLADHAMTLMEPRLAENYLNKAMTSAALAHPDDYFLLAEIYGLYADVHVAFRKREEAESLYFKAIGLVEKVDSNHVAIADLESRLGLLMEDQEKYNIAEKFYRKALSRVNYFRGSDSPQSATLHNNLASVCFMTSRPDEAMEHLKKALTIWKNEKNALMKEAEIRSNIAEIYRATQKLDKAEKEYKKIQSLMKKIPTSSELYPTLLMNLSQYYNQIDNAEKAQELEMKARQYQKELRNTYLENVSILETKFKRIPGMELK